MRVFQRDRSFAQGRHRSCQRQRGGKQAGRRDEREDRHHLASRDRRRRHVRGVPLATVVGVVEAPLVRLRVAVMVTLLVNLICLGANGPEPSVVLIAAARADPHLIDEGRRDKARSEG